ncbi:MAG: hypothetical protein ABF586_09220 [Sporolactobacillus sp.]
MIVEKIQLKESSEGGWGLAYLKAQHARYLSEGMPADRIESPSQLIEIILGEHNCLLEERKTLLDETTAALNLAHQTLDDVSSILNPLVDDIETVQNSEVSR